MNICIKKSVVLITILGVTAQILESSQKISAERKNELDFIDAAFRGDDNKVSDFLNRGVNVNAKSNKDFEKGKTDSVDGEWSALHLATNQRVLKTLLDQKNIDVNIKDYKGRTPLIWSVINARFEKEPLLLEKVRTLLKNPKVDKNAQDNLGNTALHYAATGTNLELLELLLKNGSNPEIKNNAGLKAVTLALEDEKIKNAQLFVRYGKK